jgi:hypothetical protein
MDSRREREPAPLRPSGSSSQNEILISRLTASSASTPGPRHPVGRERRRHYGGNRAGFLGQRAWPSWPATERGSASQDGGPPAAGHAAAEIGRNLGSAYQRKSAVFVVSKGRFAAEASWAGCAVPPTGWEPAQPATRHRHDGSWGSPPTSGTSQESPCGPVRRMIEWVQDP